ncbi:hypothetical protein GR247_38680 [Rhizobium leguminosarum]|nr:hypothetical protein [Rhizobium leguminosarum]
MTLQIVRDWVIRFNARGPSGLTNGKAPGNQGKLSDVHRQALAKIVESGPIVPQSPQRLTIVARCSQFVFRCANWL